MHQGYSQIDAKDLRNTCLQILQRHRGHFLQLRAKDAWRVPKLTSTK